jgi:hypothetical protein
MAGYVRTKESEMRKRPILFSAPMVRALLDDSKTQTRRIVKPQPEIIISNEPFIQTETDDKHGRLGKRIECPYGQVGDQLWVRETHLTVCKMDDNGMFITDEHGEYIYETWYRADGIDYQYFDGQSDFPVENVPWKPSIHMPRAASRITLEITSIRVERLNDITESDVIEEGCPTEILYGRGWYKDLWEQINGVGSWDANPWVWVLEFKRVEQ